MKTFAHIEWVDRSSRASGLHTRQQRLNSRKAHAALRSLGGPDRGVERNTEAKACFGTGRPTPHSEMLKEGKRKKKAGLTSLRPDRSGVGRHSRSSRSERRLVGGARRDRTADLLHAMQALSQLSYGPLTLIRAPWATRGAP
jgi:hypothetical protein